MSNIPKVSRSIQSYVIFSDSPRENIKSRTLSYAQLMQNNDDSPIFST
jgi:hypothetical protein